MEKKVYITEKEREKCCRVIDAFEELDTYTDSHSLFEGFLEEWFVSC